MGTFRLASRLLAARRPRTPGRGRGDPARAATPDTGSERAFAVPWLVVRAGGRAYTVGSPTVAEGELTVELRGAEAAYSVRFALAGTGLLGLSLPRSVRPGERLSVSLTGRAAGAALGASDAMLVLRWFERGGTELLWPIVLE